MKEISIMESNKEQANLNEKMDPIFMDTFEMIVLTGLELILELMGKFMKANENKIKCMGKVDLYNLKDNLMKKNIKVIDKSKAMKHS